MKICCDGYCLHLDGRRFVTASNKLVLCVSEYVRCIKQYLHTVKQHIIIIIIINNQLVALLLTTCFDLVVFRLNSYKYKCEKYSKLVWNIKCVSFGTRSHFVTKIFVVYIATKSHFWIKLRRVSPICTYVYIFLIDIICFGSIIFLILFSSPVNCLV
jgi:hypothetical protein